MKRLLRPALLTLACVALTSLLVAADAPSALTVWDGETSLDGKSWVAPGPVAPAAAVNTITISDKAGPSGKKALEFKGSGAEYIGCGWNWQGWYPPEAGTDITGYDRMRFSIKIKSDTKPDMKIHLVSNNKEVGADLSIAKYLGDKDKGKIDDGEWHEIVIPVKDLLGDNKKFDPKLVWEMDVSEWSQEKMDFTASIDLVQFLPPEPKAAETKPAVAK